ncbi:MAG TPA: response regulator [Opitutaceae bacterium]|jgi:two-component system chemotaxis response regulator CheY
MKPVILAVDDALTMRKLVSFTLRGAGYDVIEATDGLEALRVARTSRFDLVLSDVNMPGMDGIEFTRQFRALPTGRSTPVLILTTESDPAKKNLARAAGATGWLVKPFQPDQLLAVVARVLPNLVPAIA